MAGGDDRLSQLSDDLLRRVLHFAPLKEAASATALSRRWRAPLWRSSGAINLEARVDRDRRDDDEASFFSRRVAFISAAVAALDAAAADHVTRLSLHLESDRDEPLDAFLNHQYGVDEEDHVVSRDRNLVNVLLSHRAARRVEELRLDAQDCRRSEAYYDGETIWSRVGLYAVTLDALPWETLRVLELTNCSGLYQPAAAAVFLPRLSSLRLRHCAQYLDSLQSVIDAAPALADVRLQSILIDTTQYGPSQNKRLRCPAATVLVLDRCRWEDRRAAVIAVEIEAPRLRRFGYKGLLRPFTFSPQPPELEQVDLQFFCPDHNRENKDASPDDTATFWRFARSFTSTKEMRLELNRLEDIAVLSEAKRVELLPVFAGLERLEVQGVHRAKGRTAAAAIGNLLRCCPVLRALRINLTEERHDVFKPSYSRGRGRGRRLHGFLERKFRADRDKSLDRLQRCGFSSKTILHEEEEDDDDGFLYDDEVCDIPIALSRCGHLLECLRSSLRIVGLQFRLDKSKNCLGVKLIKFFAENAMVLEEMHIDGGNRKFCEHMNSKTERWITNSLKRRVSGATSFVVLPLDR